MYNREANYEACFVTAASSFSN